MTPIAFGMLGLIAGSFLNVLALRFGERSLGGRSACPRCGRTIFWYDNIPLVSWVALRGRCRFCKERISLQYPLVELATGALFAAAGAAPIPLFQKVVALPIIALLIVITIYDFYHTIIPDLWVYPFAALALIFSLGSPLISPILFSPESLADFQDLLLWILSAGPLVALPLFLLWFFSRGRWMGLGDSKLALGMGWLLGTAGGYGALFIAFMAGGAVGTVLLFLSSRWGKSLIPSGARYTMKSEIPFGPFLTVATFIVWFAQMHSVALPLPWTY